MPVDDTTRESPAADPLYFMSCITYITNTPHNDLSNLSVHDLVDAYNSFSSRLMGEAASLSTFAPEHVTLVHFRECAPKLVHQLLQNIDLMRLSCELWITTSTLGDADNDTQGLLQRKISNATLIGHHSLRIVALIFEISGLCSVFSEYLDKLLSRILSLSQRLDLPTFDQEKTISLVLWILHVQRLPIHNLTPYMPSIMHLVDVVLSKHDSSRSLNSSLIDVLQAISSLIPLYHVPFMQFIANRLPSLFTLWEVDDIMVRKAAASVISKFALSVHQIGSEVSEEVLAEARNNAFRYLQQQVRHSPEISGFNLVITLKDYLAVTNEPQEKHRSSKRRGSWAITTLASLVVLCDYKIFASRRSSDLIASFLHQESSFLIPFSREQEALWCCALWAYWKHLDLKLENKHMESGMTGKREGFIHHILSYIEKSTHGIVISTAAIATLLGTPYSHPEGQSRAAMSSIVSLLGMLIRHQSQSRMRNHGRLLLLQCLGGLASSSNTLSSTDIAECNRGYILPHNLLQGGMDSSGPLTPNVNISIVRHLQEAEILSEWDSLFDLWQLCIFYFLRKGNYHSIPQNATIAWQTLLLAPAHLTQGYTHLTSDDMFANKIVSALVRIIDLRDSESKFSSTFTSRRLRYATELWSAVKNTFTGSWLSLVATQLFSSIITYQLADQDEGTRASWSYFCADLFCLGGIDAVEVTWTLAAVDDAVKSLETMLWNAVAEMFYLKYRPSSAIEDSKDSEPLVIALSNPAWNNKGLQVAFLRRGIEAESLNATELVNRIVRSCFHDLNQLDMLVTITSAYSAYIADHTPLDLPVHLLEAIASIMNQLYPSRTKHDPCMRVVHAVGEMLQVLPNELLIRFILSVSSWMSILIRDPLNLIENNYYNDVVIEFYNQSLQRLSSFKLDSSDMEDMIPYLTSVFDRDYIPAPAQGPMVFKRFCDAQFGNDSENKRRPKQITSYLRAYAEVMGYHMPASPSTFDSDVYNATIH